MVTPDLYLDVDGVVLYQKPNEWVLEMFKRILPLFDRRFWLSCWTKTGDTERLYSLHPELKFIDAKPLVWRREKFEAIDWVRPFIWIEDGVSEMDRAEFTINAKPGQHIWEIRNGIGGKCL